MTEPIVPRSIVLDRARLALESGQPIHQFQAWPIGTAAGQLFQRELQHLQALREAQRRVAEEVHA
ncbi:hypothetical protein KW843_22855 [Acidovorax sp. sif1233]|uniref:hypothetical protein n=1 Tax=Acidovorax sp. sif1233 TaxID=2854792 RepID=UPI001C44456C|nr:hypothetical protein [Acidovorax sp. sif1233]MBV7457339.1 hypothetical protein [Acidovorax sp. sif1233]